MNRSMDTFGELAGHDVLLSRQAAQPDASRKRDRLATPLPAWMRAMGRLLRSPRGWRLGSTQAI